MSNSQNKAVLLGALKGWKIQDNKLEKTFFFKTFDDVVVFFNFIAQIAIQMNHHPEFWTSYKTCKVMLFTHDLHEISKLDFDFARKIDEDYK